MAALHAVWLPDAAGVRSGQPHPSAKSPRETRLSALGFLGAKRPEPQVTTLSTHWKGMAGPVSFASLWGSTSQYTFPANGSHVGGSPADPSLDSGSIATSHANRGERMHVMELASWLLHCPSAAAAPLQGMHAYPSPSTIRAHRSENCCREKT